MCYAAEDPSKERALVVERSFENKIITFTCTGLPGELVFVKVPIVEHGLILGATNDEEREEEFGYEPYGHFWIASRELPVTVWQWCQPVHYMDLRTQDPKWLDAYKPMNILSLQLAQKWVEIFNDALAESGLHFAVEIPFETDWEYSAVALLGKHPDLSNFTHFGVHPRAGNLCFNIDMLNSPSKEFKETFDFLGGLEEITQFCSRSPEDSQRNIIKVRGEPFALLAVLKGGSVIHDKSSLRFSSRRFLSEPSAVPEAGLRLLLREN